MAADQFANWWWKSLAPRVQMEWPGKDALDAVENLLVSIVLVGRRRQLLPGGDENLEH